MHQPSNRRRLKVAVPIVAVLVVIIGIAVFAISHLSAPAVGQVSQKPADKTLPADPYAEPQNYEGKYISFTYPAHYKKLPTKLTGSYLEVDDFYTTIQNGRQISIGVMPGSLADSSAISYRKQHPELYTALPRTQYSQSFLAKSGLEQTDFIQHNNLLVSVTISSQNVADFSDDYATIVSSLRWK